jgi:hypothetical protein
MTLGEAAPGRDGRLAGACRARLHQYHKVVR